MSEHKFRYLLPPGNNFAFVAKFKIWLIISILLMSASIASLFVNKQVRGEYMNWNIDFKGGTEIILAFKDKAGAYTTIPPGKIREILEKTDKKVEVSEISWKLHDKDGKEVPVNGMVVRTTRFAAIQPDQKAKASELVVQQFADRDIQKAPWSGDRMNIRSRKHIKSAEIRDALQPMGLEVREWLPEEQALYEHADEGTGEFSQWYTIAGIDKQYEHALEKELGVEVEVHQSYGVGAKAGEKLRDDGIKSIIYAIFLIMLYLAFRFDIRYAPGAAFATIHDAVMVIGVFAVTWTEVSLVSVAGLLTVVGFSVNDTVVVFDRIRENQAKLKDKKIERIIDISINEVLVRSILTSATVFATTLIMNIFGAGLVQNFAFAMNVGVIVGAYSSIFLAAPFFLYITRKWYSGNTAPRRRVAAAPVVKKEEKSDEPDE
jgi:preprotein translocase subunit SecF